MKQTRALMTGTLLVLLLALTALIGCSSIIIHPIKNTDIFPIDKGVAIGNVTTASNGYFVSDYYVKEVMRARVDKVR
jgi:hypothetical protein